MPENDNNAIDQVAGILADIAIRHNVAIDVPHHASKATTDPGDPNKARGASSFIDAGRLSYTLTAMSGVEAQMFGVSEEERRSLVRVDTAKVNLVPGSPTADAMSPVDLRARVKTEICSYIDQEAWDLARKAQAAEIATINTVCNNRTKITKTISDPERK